MYFWYYYISENLSLIKTPLNAFIIIFKNKLKNVLNIKK